MKTTLLVLAIMVGALLNILVGLLRRKKTPPPLPNTHRGCVVDAEKNALPDIKLDEKGRWLPIEMVVNPNPIHIYCLDDDPAKKVGDDAPLKSSDEIPDIRGKKPDGGWGSYYLGINDLMPDIDKDFPVSRVPAIDPAKYDLDFEKFRAKGKPISKKIDPEKEIDKILDEVKRVDKVADAVHPDYKCGCDGGISMVTWKCVKCDRQHYNYPQLFGNEFIIDCRTCGRKINTQVDKCYHCGLEKERQFYANSCACCKYPIPQAYTYCSNCGPCPYCNTNTNQRLPVCTHCGRSFKDGSKEEQYDPDLSARNLYRLRGMRQAATKPNSDSDFLRDLPEGVTSIRILPAAPNGVFNTHNWFVARRQHYLGSYGKGRNDLTVQCKKRPVNGKWHGECPICDKWNEVWKNVGLAEKDGNFKEASRLKEVAGTLKPRPRFYYNVIVNSSHHKSVIGKTVPIIYSAGEQIHNQICRHLDENYCKSQGEEATNIVDLGPKGYSIKIIKRLSGSEESRAFGHPGWPTYDVMPHLRPKVAGTNDEIEAWMANLWDLEMVALGWDKDAATMEAMFKDACAAFNLDIAYHKEKTQKEIDELAVADDDFLKELKKMC